MANTKPALTTIRNDLRPGDVGRIVALHGVTYAKEHGFDATFEAYVAGPLADFVRQPKPRDRLWIAEIDDRLVGCIAIVAARGLGLGRRLLDEAIAFARKAGFISVFLWTVSALTAAASLYRAAGFRKVEEVPGRQWGVGVVEEKYVLELR